MEHNRVTEDFTPRPYQVELMKIALEKNTIIFLPTGSGKTYIAVMVLKQMCAPLLKKYSEGGKITVFLVNSVALVEQHAKNVSNHTSFKVGQYTGEMNLDFWPRAKWYEEYDKHQVLIMTCQILLNLVTQNYIDLNKINLLIFDECHHGVNDHPMRSIMKAFQGVQNPPRVLGLTATLLNKNCEKHKVLQEIQNLETTFHGQVATVDGLSEVIGYSTDPVEDFQLYENSNSTHVQKTCESLIHRFMNVVEQFQSEAPSYTLKHLEPLSEDDNLKSMKNMLKEIIHHINILGPYGSMKATISYMIQLERLKKHCQDLNMLALFTSAITNLSFMKQLLVNYMKDSMEIDQINKYSSDKILKLIEIFRVYPTRSKEELCAIIFTKRRFTAKIIFHILDALRQCNPEFRHIKTDYMVGYNNNPYNCTRESLFIAKKNKQVVESFRNKKINVIVASNVLEEGVDMQRCTLVIRFDLPEDYRGYVQSKGRARHRESIFYMMIDKNETEKFLKKYSDFKAIEEALNNYLIGRNKERDEPSTNQINQMYREAALPPYYVAGKNSAFVDMQSAIPLLCQYCSSLPSDTYTVYAPEWYIDPKVNANGEKLHSVVILLPVVSPLHDIIQGKCMRSIKNAKKAAALEACKRLHQIGELDDHLLPRKEVLRDDDVNFLFRHYPKVKEERAGFSTNRRLYPIQVAKYLKGPIKPENKFYLHIINLEPAFRRSSNVNDGTLYDIYSSPTCYGILTPNILPTLCAFPIFVTLGTINVSFKFNQKELEFNEEELRLVKLFHFTVFDGVLKILTRCAIFDNSNDAEALLIVPVDKMTGQIDINILKEEYNIKNITEPTGDEKKQLEVTQETFLKKIVVPWYRDSYSYVVTEVCLNKSAFTDFPNEEYSNYKDYFFQKHSRYLLRPDLPLLFVKAITTRLNYIKPRGIEITKRKRDRLYEEMSEHLPSELVMKQDFPSSLWIQASFLPTILHRFRYMLQLEELQCKIFEEAGLGKNGFDTQPSLTLEEYLLQDVEEEEEEEEDSQEIVESNIADNISPTDFTPVSLNINQDFNAKVLESEFPWKDIDEPRDILKSLDVTLMEIEHYEAFINEGVDNKDAYTLKNENLNKTLAITYPIDFQPKKIALLENHATSKGPTIRDLYCAMTAAKADEIVNLERLETLGDSFLKLISSVYISLRFPNYNEGKATQLKGRLVSNKNLYYLAVKKNLCGIMKFTKLSPREDWLTPGFKIPEELTNRILNKEVSINILYHLTVPLEEQLSGILTNETKSEFKEEEAELDNEDASYNNLASYLNCQYIGDKHVADVVESLLGCYFQTCGFQGGLTFLEWIGLFPKSENIAHLLQQPSPDPVLNKNATDKDIKFHIPHWETIETILGYKFQNHAYLLQALTHSSYSTNRITLSYEKLEFLGDAILDFLITCHIYESCGKLNPGDLTDLRSALVNNNTFASLIVRNGLHKFLLMINQTLQKHIDKFVEFFKGKHYDIDDEILILLSEDELNLAEYVDVPKVLGDIFEALAGAIYLDSGKDLKTVWKVFYKLMWKEIELFSKNIPKNSVRMLFEKPGLHPKFASALLAADNKTIIPLQFRLEGRTKTVYGCGTNKVMAKKAAAKLALRCTEL